MYSPNAFNDNEPSGYDVVINYNNSIDEALKVEEEVKKIGRNAILVKCDVSCKASVKNMIFTNCVKDLEKTDNIVNDGIFNVVGDRIDNNISGGGKINVNSSMELAGNINGENTVNLNEGNIHIADENTLGENVKLNIAKTGKAVKLAVETMAIRVKEVIFGIIS